jgi:GNAT superfamily N-acetyltransferase
MNEEKALPPGKITLVTTYLEMLAPPPRVPMRLPAGMEVVFVKNIPLHYYRYLYHQIGAKWGWWERKTQSDDTVCAEIHHPGFSVYVAHFDGAPGGLVELDGRDPEDIQLNYFGLFPERCGQGHGRLLLDWSVNHVWSHTPVPRRYWVHTCNLDSPAALPTYLGAGFSIYGEKREVIDDPRPA